MFDAAPSESIKPDSLNENRRISKSWVLGGDHSTLNTLVSISDKALNPAVSGPTKGAFTEDRSSQLT